MTLQTVTSWSHWKFDQPTPLYRRDAIQPGDVVASSHGYNLLITSVRVSDHPEGSTELRGIIVSRDHVGGTFTWSGPAVERNEIYPNADTIPVLARRDLDAERQEALEQTTWSAWMDASRAAVIAQAVMTRQAAANDPAAVATMAALDQLRLAEAALSAAMTALGGK